MVKEMYCHGTVINDANTNINFDSPVRLEHDPVNHPSHYTQGSMQVIDIIEQYGFCDDFRLGNCVKYLFRHKLKGTALEDLKKARWYLNRKIASMEQEQP